MNRILLSILVTLWVGAFLAPAQVIATTIDFESLADSETVTSQFLGLTFSNTLALSAGIGLNEGDFPPHSGVTVVSDAGGPIIIDFSPVVVDVSGFFTYLTSLTLMAFDEFDLINPVDTATSSSSSNLGSSEMLEVQFAGGIARLVIEGDLSGSSFILDDLSYTLLPESSPIPEPSALLLLASGLIGTWFLRKRNR